MTESESFWEFYWKTRLAEIETLGKRAAILAASRVILRLSKQLGRPLRLLELGCGEGQIIGTLLDAHASLCDVRASAGVDYQAQSLARCRRLVPGARWVKGDFTDATLIGGLGEFDVVLLINALHEVFSASYCVEMGEINIPLGKQKVERAFSLAVSRLSSHGNLVLFDGVEPAGDPGQPIRIRFHSAWARDEFDDFVHGYRPFQITYQKLDNAFSIELSQHDFIRYITKSIFIRKKLWESECLESYQYFTEAEFRAMVARQGMEITDIETFTVNDEKWRHRVEIISAGSEFPQEHIFMIAQRGGGSS